MELQMKAICQGQTTKNVVVQQSLEQYRFAYARTKDQMGVLKAVSVELLFFARFIRELIND
jgi:DNA topoisomerase-3